MMDRSGNVVGVAAPLEWDDVDTDQIVPAEFLKVVEKKGMGRYLFYRRRYGQDGAERADFVLNQPAYRSAAILVAGANFGIGSSRENAVWALLDGGIRCVIATSFGDIFENNAARNALLCVRLDEPTVARLRSLARKGAAFYIDVPAQTVTAGSEVTAFQMDPHAKKRFLEGRDEVSTTLETCGPAISGYEARMPAWAHPSSVSPVE